jgi:hypothetical protein
MEKSQILEKLVENAPLPILALGVASFVLGAAECGSGRLGRSYQ